MKNKLKHIISKRLSDLILIIVVVLIFLLTGKSNTKTLKNEPTSNNASIEDPKAESETRLNDQTELNTQEITPEIVSNSNNNSSNEKKSIQEPIPVSKMFPNKNIQTAPVENKLAESFKSLKSKEASQEDIVDRNAYFKSLSEQMNKLQGSASTDSEGKNNQNGDEPAYDDEELDGEEENDLDEIPIVTQEGANNPTTQHNNPYKDLNEQFTAPDIAE